MKSKFNRRNVNIIMLLNALVNFYAISQELKEPRKLEIEAQIDEIYIDTYDSLKYFFNTRCIFIFDSTERIIRHLNVKNNNLAMVRITRFGNSPTICNHNNIINLITESTDEESKIVIFLNTNNAALVNRLKEKEIEVFLAERIFENLAIEKKNLLIMNIVKEIRKHKTRSNFNSKYARKMGIYTDKNVEIETLFVDVFCYDTICYINSQLKNNPVSLKNKRFRELFKDLHNLFEASNITPYGPQKVYWLDRLIKDSLALLLKYNVLKEPIDVSLFPEIVSMLFPIPFISLSGKTFTNYEIVRFGISFSNIHEFAYFDEFFDKKMVKDLNVCFKQIYFTRFAT